MLSSQFKAILIDNSRGKARGLFFSSQHHTYHFSFQNEEKKNKENYLLNLFTKRRTCLEMQQIERNLG